MNMPNFLVIGANKSGTTALAHHLGEHPQIYMSPVKEPMFFLFDGVEISLEGPGETRMCSLAVNSLDQYLKLFAGVRNERAIGEASTAYLHNPPVADRIRRYVPQMKLVAVLRHPAERAFSNYLMYRREGLEQLPTFREAVDVESQRIEDGYPQGWHYVQLGYYHRTMERYYELFGRDQIRVYLYEDWRDRPQQILCSVFRFLEVNDACVPRMTTKRNVSYVVRHPWLETLLHHPRRAQNLVRGMIPQRIRQELAGRINAWNRHRPTLSQEDRRRLIDVYRNDILQLQGLIRRDLTHWLDYGT